MKTSVREELLAYIEEFEGALKNHFTMFNEDFYIIGYHRAEEWLKGHDIGVFEAMAICNEYERDHFGEVQTAFEDAETLVNNLVYWYGWSLCNDLQLPFDYEG